MNLKLLTPLMLAAGIAVSCGSSKKFQASNSEDKPLFSAINELNKRPGNEKAQADLKHFFSNSVQHHEDMIDAYRSVSDPAKWDRMLSEFNALQNIYTSLQATPGTFSLVRPKNYRRDIEQLREQAAAQFYDKGTNLLRHDGRANALDAHHALKNADRFIKGYRDTERLLQESYERSVVNVVINPIQDNNIMFSRFDAWGTDFRYRPEEYQQALARDLGSRRNDDFPARFFTDREADRKRIRPDYEINLAWRNLDGLRSNPNHYTRQVSKNIQVGSDTAGRPIYKQVFANLQVTRNRFNVRGDLEYQVSDGSGRSNIDYGTVSEQVQWEDSYATYSGDSRALSSEDWSLVNNNASRQSPSRSDIMNELMRKIYPDLRRRIESAIN